MTLRPAPSRLAVSCPSSTQRRTVSSLTPRSEAACPTRKYGMRCTLPPHRRIHSGLVLRVRQIGWISLGRVQRSSPDPPRPLPPRGAAPGRAPAPRPHGTAPPRDSAVRTAPPRARASALRSRPCRPAGTATRTSCRGSALAAGGVALPLPALLGGADGLPAALRTARPTGGGVPRAVDDVGPRRVLHRRGEGVHQPGEGPHEEQQEGRDDVQLEL